MPIIPDTNSTTTKIGVWKLALETAVLLGALAATIVTHSVATGVAVLGAGGFSAGIASSVGLMNAKDSKP